MSIERKEATLPQGSSPAQVHRRAARPVDSAASARLSAAVAGPKGAELQSVPRPKSDRRQPVPMPHAFGDPGLGH
ncbi:hypothetical protein CONPUDRAFT_151766 [Coniophora puteana RWD-64-598 SS2]|uniref:Uncharacterized protein n=1 Tax=Coniophora puteana (strain RWD-64-598) TaxID=741705 RepID=A0A5M3MUA4_CONPW|nr:uncharacterized protein CONPUDRAFT_151766 [Coniophora puteana RWD-64-598 SS2]EIW82709.1 hypothetical protein CONPUDRAFT_151766 [Coniophora puteana RWD-64-598 SS2]